MNLRRRACCWKGLAMIGSYLDRLIVGNQSFFSLAE
jgi:hypothetical protein